MLRCCSDVEPCAALGQCVQQVKTSSKQSARCALIGVLASRFFRFDVTFLCAHKPKGTTDFTKCSGVKSEIFDFEMWWSKSKKSPKMEIHQ